MWDHLSFVIERLRERLWIRPLIVGVLSIGAVFLANLMPMTELSPYLPEISKESTVTLLKIMASSMLIMATFAVAAMVAAYASAVRSATPRSFSLIIGDDVSQNALSAFIGAFIFSVVALVALMNGSYGGRAGHFILFSLTMAVLAVVVLTFIRWVDNIARLGRLEYTIDKVEAAARRRFGSDSRRRALGASRRSVLRMEAWRSSENPSVMCSVLMSPRCRRGRWSRTELLSRRCPAPSARQTARSRGSFGSRRTV
jgi:uncharacterized membrane protein